MLPRPYAASDSVPSTLRGPAARDVSASDGHGDVVGGAADDGVLGEGCSTGEVSGAEVHPAATAALSASPSLAIRKVTRSEWHASRAPVTRQ